MSTIVAPHGPKGLPFLGNIPQLKKDPLGFLSHCVHTYGDVVRLSLAGQIGFLVNNPHFIEQILVDNAHNFVKTSGKQSKRSPKRRDHDLLIWVRNFPSDGETWLPDRELTHPSHRERREMQPAFRRERVDAYAKEMAAFTEQMLSTWKVGETRDIHKDMTHLAIAIIAATLFSAESAGMAKQLVGSFNTIIVQIVSQMVNPLQIPAVIPTPHNLRLRKAVAQVGRFLDNVVYQHQAKDFNDLVSMLLEAQAEKGDAVGKNDWRYQAMTVFVAGYETTALTLTWALYLISQNPEVEARLLAELNTVLSGRAPCAADVPMLRYTGMVIKETLRLYPPVWLLGPRIGIEEFTIGNYLLPAGSMILISPWVTHRDPRYFENPQIFKPDRWSDEAEIRPPKYAYFPFSGGERQCIGKHYATMEAIVVLATIVQTFRLTMASGAPVAPQPLVTLQPRHGMPMILEARRR